MTVNATIFIQAINFFIAYIFLRTFLFKPAVAVIQHEQKEEESVKAIITQQEESLILKEKERQEHWYKCRTFFEKHRPAIDTSLLFIFKGRIPDVTPYRIDDAVVEKLMTDVERALIEEVSVVHE